MFPTRRGRPAAGRQLVLVVLAVTLGTVLLLGSGGRSSTGTTRLEATQALVPGADKGTASPRGPTAEVDAASSAPTTAVLVPQWAEVTGTWDPASRPSTPAPGEQVPPSARAVQPQAPAGPGDTAGAPPTTGAPPPAPTTSTPVTRPLEVTTTTGPVAATAPVRAGVARAPAAEADVVPLTNRDRTGEGLGSLTRNACLDSVASGYAEALARSGVLAHNPGAGPAVGGCRANATWGDNIGTAAPCDTALIEERWMASPTHRHNILTGAFQLIGVGAWTDPQGGCWIQVLFST